MSVHPNPETFELVDEDFKWEMPAAEGISFDKPCTEAFKQVREGFISLGMVPNRKAIEGAIIKPEQEQTVIKNANDNTFRVPKALSVLIPFIKRAAAFEAANSPHYTQKSAMLTARDVIINAEGYSSERSEGDLHRDPRQVWAGSLHSFYSFASCQPTKFLDDNREPQSFEVACFTPTAIHWRPAIVLKDSQESLRRLFVAVSFNLDPPRDPTKVLHGINLRVHPNVRRPN